jgi:hypothetical protein
MTVALGDALAALPERTLARLAGPIDVAGLSADEPVAFAGHVRRQGERGLLVVSDRELVFAAETGGSTARRSSACSWPTRARRSSPSRRARAGACRTTSAR